MILLGYFGDPSGIVPYSKKDAHSKKVYLRR